ncbi:MAG TPA: fumarylacetoacetate hydrolase family protein, partial [bacterium]|nr:fumarylacetoacetate hydrolase family protein [bacterium]
MRIARVWVPGQGPRLGLCENGTVHLLASPDAPVLDSFEALAQVAHRTRRRLTEAVQHFRGEGPAYSYRDLDRAPSPEAPHLLLPVVPPEVWAAGVTYERSREARLAETTTVGIYDKVYEAERPELFLKATASRCVGPNVPIGIRADSRWTVPEPELGVVLGTGGKVLGYTLGNDMSARDIEGENPLYLPQTKIYRACCSLGPTVLVTDEPVERRLTLWCRITRGTREIFRGEVSTARIRRPISELIAYLRRSNDIPPMTVLLTGTGIVPPDEFACEE